MSEAKKEFFRQNPAISEDFFNFVVDGSQYFYCHYLDKDDKLENFIFIKHISFDEAWSAALAQMNSDNKPECVAYLLSHKPDYKPEFKEIAVMLKKDCMQCLLYYLDNHHIAIDNDFISSYNAYRQGKYFVNNQASKLVECMMLDISLPFKNETKHRVKL